MKKPTKQELYERIAKLERMQQKEYEERNREKRRKWDNLLPAAFAECRKQLKAIFPNLITLLHFEHVDEGGYWFTFELENDTRRQTYAVRHSDLQQEDAKQ